jgi:hypothetical protein
MSWSTRKKRIENEEGWHRINDWWYKIPYGKFSPRRIRDWQYFLAHQCDENTIRACGAVQSWRGKRKISIYAYCSNCQTTLTTKIKTIIKLHGATGEV